MSAFDFSTFTAEARRIAHRSGRGDGDADRAADWVQLIVQMIGGAASTLNEFPLAQYTPSNQALTNDNFVQAFDNAVAACIAGGGGKVTIPAGIWDISSELRVSTVATAYNSSVVFIEGAGQITTTIRYPDNYSGNGLYLNGGTAPATAAWQWGGVRNLTIQGGVTGVGASGKGLTLNACVGVIFENVTIFNWGQSGGTGVYCRDFTGAGGNSQDLLFVNCDIRTCYNNFDVKAFMATFINVKSIQAANRAFLGDNVILNMFGGNFQTNSPVVFELVGEGGCRILIEGAYWEGIVSQSIFKLGAPTVAANTVEIKRFISGGVPIFMDASGPSTDVTLDTIIGAFSASTSFVKARNLDRLTIINPGGDYDTWVGKFDLDTTSRGNMFYRDGGYVRSGGAQFVGTTLNLAGYAQGFEPTASNQAVVFNTSTSRARVKALGSWNDIALTSDAFTLYDLLSPYAVEIFDFGVSASLTTSITAPTAVVGLQHATSATNGVGGQSPAVAASQRFRGQYGATCTYDAAATTSKFFKGTLATSVAAGARPGVFVVFAPSTTSTAAAQRCPIGLKGASDSFKVDFDDGNTGASGLNVYYKAATVALSGITTSTIRPHVLYAAATSGGFDYQFDGVTGNTGPSSAVLTAPLTTVTIGCSGDAGDNTGSDVTVLFLAVLNQSVPSQIVDKAQKLAKTLYGIL